MTARQVVVHGRVQGVFFRASTRDLARTAGVRGWVRNDADGTVTMHLQGEHDAVADVVAWVRDGGPDHASVDRVEVTDVPADDVDDFTIRH